MRDFKITQRIHTPNQNLARYFTEIHKEKLLSVEEEAELAYKAKMGDGEAKEKIVRANLRFVVSVAKAYSSPGVLLEDLISEGNKGLIEAIEKFEPETGFKFISYAVWHIRKNIFYFISQYGRQIRVPTNILQELTKYQKIEEKFVSSFGRNPTSEEIFDIMDRDKESKPFSPIFKEHVTNSTDTVPLEPSGTDQKDDQDFGPINWISSSEESDSLAAKSDKDHELDFFMRNLKPIEKQVIEMKFGLGEYKFELSIPQISQHFGKSEEWVRTKIKSAHKTMKKNSTKSGYSGKNLF